MSFDKDICIQNHWPLVKNSPKLKQIMHRDIIVLFSILLASCVIKAKHFYIMLPGVHCQFFLTN